MAAVLARGLTTGLGGASGGTDKIEYLDDSSSRKGCLSSPFALYYIVVIATNTVAISAGILSQWDYHHRGYGYDRLDMWYFCNGVFGVVHILMSLYLGGRIEQPSAHEKNMYVYQPDTEAPPPVSPEYTGVQRDVHVVPMDRHQKDGVLKSNPQHQRGFTTTTPPYSWPRIKHVVLEDKLFAVYILFFLVYVAWHSMFDYHTRQPSMRLVMKAADIFICAAPASFVFCAVKAVMENPQ